MYSCRAPLHALQVVPLLPGSGTWLRHLQSLCLLGFLLLLLLLREASHLLL